MWTIHDMARLVGGWYEIKTEEFIKSVQLDELPEEWTKIQRKRTPDPSEVIHLLKRFAPRMATQPDPPRLPGRRPGPGEWVTGGKVQA